MIISFGKTFYIAIISLLIMSCNSNNRISEYDLNSILKSRITSSRDKKQPTMLNICETIPFQWDGVVIISPYTQAIAFEGLGINNLNQLKKEVSMLALDEGNCLLAFMHNKTVIAISPVSRLLADMNTLIGDREPIKILSNYDFCKKVCFRNLGDGKVIVSALP